MKTINEKLKIIYNDNIVKKTIEINLFETPESETTLSDTCTSYEVENFYSIWRAQNDVNRYILDYCMVAIYNDTEQIGSIIISKDGIEYMDPLFNYCFLHETSYTGIIDLKITNKNEYKTIFVSIT